eukprot:1162694-Pleurochrysis_carterae.AAC.7
MLLLDIPIFDYLSGGDSHFLLGVFSYSALAFWPFAFSNSPRPAHDDEVAHCSLMLRSNARSGDKVELEIEHLHAAAGVVHARAVCAQTG